MSFSRKDFFRHVYLLVLFFPSSPFFCLIKCAELLHTTHHSDSCKTTMKRLIDGVSHQQRGKSLEFGLLSPFAPTAPFLVPGYVENLLYFPMFGQKVRKNCHAVT